MCDTHVCVTHTYVWHTRLCDTHVCVTHTYVWHTRMCDTHVCVTHTYVWHTRMCDTHNRTYTKRLLAHSYMLTKGALGICAYMCRTCICVALVVVYVWHTRQQVRTWCSTWYMCQVRTQCLLVSFIGLFCKRDLALFAYTKCSLGEHIACCRVCHTYMPCLYTLFSAKEPYN